MVTGVTLAALGVSFIIYLGVGWVLGRKTTGIGDLLPLGFNRQARVATSGEFSASTVATTISLATVVLAFFEMAEDFGIWLFWTVVTTSLGLFVVRLFARRIWNRMEAYDHRPTLHEFLGTEYNSEALSYVSAACTSMGFLTAFAVELTVGSRFFGWLVPGVPIGIVVVVLSVVSFIYTAMGGFRAVIITDRIQMVSIWLLLLAMPVFYIVYTAAHGGLADNWSKIPPEVWSFSARDGLWSFMLGIVIINVPTFLSDMSVWQRIAGAQKDQTVIGGLWASVVGSAATWTAFVVLACSAFLIVPKPDKRGLLVGVLDAIGHSGGFVNALILFCIVLGLYGAMLSTASTQLIAVSHSLYEDLFCRRKGSALKDRLNSTRELRISRTILIGSAVISMLMVLTLSRVGFSIADLVFAIYGAQVGLCPLAICALLLNRNQLKGMSDWAASAVTAGFVIGWGTALFGRLMNHTQMVYLAPVFSLLTSGGMLGIGFFVSSGLRKEPRP
jgi:Na+/proline symporter